MSGELQDEESANSAVPPGKKIFVSYSRRDRQTAEALCRALKKRNIPYWIDKQDIVPGSKFRGEIVDAIDQSAGLILLLSESSNQSAWVQQEVARAVAKGKSLFPVKIANVQPSKELVLHIAVLETVELLERPFKTAELDRLAGALLQALRSEGEGPSPRASTIEPGIPIEAVPASGNASGTPVKPLLDPATGQRLRQPARPSVRPKRESPERAKQNPGFDRTGKFVGTRSLVFMALAFAAACASVWWVDSEVADNNPGSVTAQRLFSVAMAYQYFVTLSPFHLEPGNVMVIEISDKDGVSDRNTCREREFIGNVLKTLASAQPTVVAIDKYFENVKCDGGTDQLIAGMKMLCQADAKVIVGRGVNAEALKTEMKQYPLDAALDFRKAGAACVSEGLLNLDPDFRRVSLWYPNVQPVAYSNSAPPSLPLAAALAYKQDLKAGVWPPTDEPPYVSFLEPRKFDKYKRNARDILGEGGDDWRQRVRGKAVLIGELDTNDQHPTVLGDVDGYLLQANYIESLIANRVFRAVPEWLDWIGGLAIFISFEYLAWRFSGLKALAAFAGLIVGVVLAIYLTVNLAAYYFNPAPVGFLSALYSRLTARVR